MNNLLDNLNKQQKEAVEHTEGPLLILAGAGSGKTRVLTYRMAYLINEKNVNPYNILAITFTNKAAREMKDRVQSLLEGSYDMWVSTFHAACARILRMEVEKLSGYKKNFVIFDTDDQVKLIKECLKELNYNEKNFPPKDILSQISKAKDQLLTPGKFMDRYGRDFRLKKVADIYSLYQKKLMANNALDFDDILFKTVELFQNNPDVLSYYQNKFKYIMVDEYQDTNYCQYMLVNLLAKSHRNLCVVGDDDQCIPEGTMIKTKAGQIPVENIKTGMEIITAAGFGEISSGVVDKISKRPYQGKLIRIKTTNGKEFTATPYHITFACLNPKEEVFYVYLMYKKDYGYRIGQTQGLRNRKKNTIDNGLAIRLNGEKADKMWIIKVCRDRNEATFYEELFSVKYGIPKVCFYEKGRKIIFSQDQIKEIYKRINTVENSEKLMRDYYLLPEYPHHIASAVIRGETVRRNVYINYYSGKRTTAGTARAHRISLITSGENYRQQFEKAGFSTRYTREDGWRVETERKKYDEANMFAEQLASVDESLELYRKAKLTKDRTFMFMPVGSLREGMSIAAYENDELTEDAVVEISEIDYYGYVYDLSVPEFRQFFANDILIHNCIYSWRGADIGNILNFEKDFPDVKVIKLEQNYRSTQTILDAANSVISNNFGRKSKKLWTDNGEGKSIVYYKALDERDEGDFIIGEIDRLAFQEQRDLKSFAILYRTNAQSRVIEEMCMARGIPYKIVGGHRFYDRMEVKDVIAYLRAVQDPDGDLSVKRIINVPKRGIGKATIDILDSYARETGNSFYEALIAADSIDGIGKKARNSIKDFIRLLAELMDTAEKESASDVINEVILKSGYLEELEKGNDEDQERGKNIKELISAALEYEEKNEDNSLTGFLENMALMSDIDGLKEEREGITMMTLHSAKGLEFPVVFICGLEEGLFPTQRAFFEELQLEEERRLMYVGVTRAREKLYLTSAFNRTIYGSSSYTMESRFLREIPKDLLVKV